MAAQHTKKKKKEEISQVDKCTTFPVAHICIQPQIKHYIENYRVCDLWCCTRERSLSRLHASSFDSSLYSDCNYFCTKNEEFVQREWDDPVTDLLLWLQRSILKGKELIPHHDTVSTELQMWVKSDEIFSISFYFSFHFITVCWKTLSMHQKYDFVV